MLPSISGQHFSNGVKRRPCSLGMPVLRALSDLGGTGILPVIDPAFRGIPPGVFNASCDDRSWRFVKSALGQRL